MINCKSKWDWYCHTDSFTEKREQPTTLNVMDSLVEGADKFSIFNLRKDQQAATKQKRPDKSKTSKWSSHQQQISPSNTTQTTFFNPHSSSSPFDVLSPSELIDGAVGALRAKLQAESKHRDQ